MNVLPRVLGLAFALMPLNLRGDISDKQKLLDRVIKSVLSEKIILALILD